MKCKLIFASVSLLVAFTLYPAFAYAQDYPAGLTHYYELEESAPPYSDSRGSNDGVSSLPPTSTTGIVGNGQSFNQNEININDDDSFDWGSTSSFTVEFWVKDNTADTDVEVYTGRNDGDAGLHWWIGAGAWFGDNIVFQLTDNTRTGTVINSSVSIYDNQWHHIVAVRDGVQGKNLLYVDGVEKASESIAYSNDFSAANTPINIGWLNLSDGFYSNSNLDEVALYSTALTPSDIQNHYDRGLLGFGYFEIIDAPDQLTAQPGFKKVDLEWHDNSDNEDGFIIEKEVVPGSFNVIHTTSADITSFTDTDVTATTTYKYRVKAYNALMESDYSNEVTTTTPLFTVSAPSGLTAVLNSIDPSNVDLSWNDNSSNETYFIITRALGDIISATVFSKIDSVGAGVTTFTDATADYGTTYTYQIYARNADTVSTLSNKAEVTTPEEILAPDQLTGDPQFDRVELDWNDNSNNEDGFIIERAPVPGAFAVIGSVGANIKTYTDMTVDDATPYKYRVKAYVGLTESNYSNEISVTTLSEPVNPPQQLTAQAKFQRVELGWVDNSDNEDGFIIERSELNPFPSSFTVIDTVAADCSTYVDGNVSDLTTYKYRIKAYNSLMESATIEVSVTTFLSTVSAPGNLVALMDMPEATKVKLSWDDNSTNESGFIIQRALGDTLQAIIFISIDTIAADRGEYTDSTTDDLTMYTYRVCAYNVNTISPFSNKTQITTPLPVELTSFRANVSNGKIIIEWETASEINNSGFSLEGSKDNQVFTEVAFIKGKGTTTNKSIYTYVDNSVLSGKYIYRLKQIDFDGTYEYSKSIEVDLGIPGEITLGQNYPNPFNPTTKIRYSVPGSSRVSIKIYNTLGQEVMLLVDGEVEAGVHEATLNGSDLSSGIYFYRLEAKGMDGSSFSATKRMLLIK